MSHILEVSLLVLTEDPLLTFAAASCAFEEKRQAGELVAISMRDLYDPQVLTEAELGRVCERLHQE